MNKIKILFVCIHNSARSQMAEVFMNSLGGDVIEAQSAGLEPGALNTAVVKAMKEIGIDISKNTTKSVFDFYKKGYRFNYVITVCDEASGERCPVFPGISKRLHWSFADPSAFIGTEADKMRKIRQVRDAVENKVKEFIAGLINRNDPAK